MLSCARALIFLGFFVLGIKGRVLSQNTSAAVFLSYNDLGSCALYEAWRVSSGELSFLFNSNKPTAFLAYQEDGIYDYFDLFLVNGKIRARLTFNECRRRQLTVDGNFSDSRWHRVHLAHRVDSVTLTVDGCFSESISCNHTAVRIESWKALYVGNFPLNITSFNSVVQPRILEEAFNDGFQGCIGQVTQTTLGESPKPLALLYSEKTGADCKSYCITGEKCDPLDDVNKKECECPGYEKKSLVCRRYSALSNVDIRNTVQFSSTTQSHSASIALSSIHTPMFSSLSQTNAKKSSSLKITASSTATRAQSVSTHTQGPSGVKAQHAKVAVERQPSSVPGHFSNSQHLVPEHTSSLPLTAPFTSPVVVLYRNSAENNNSVVMAKRSSALLILGSRVLLCIAMTALLVSSFMN